MNVVKTTYNTTFERLYSMYNLLQCLDPCIHNIRRVTSTQLECLLFNFVMSQIIYFVIWSKFLLLLVCRIWKSFTLWKNNIRRHKNAGMR